MKKFDDRIHFLRFRDLDPLELFGKLKTPCYVIDEAMLEYDGEILKGVRERTGAKILLAQKCFSNYNLYPVLEKYLDGTEASGLFEARLGREEMPQKEVHTFCGAFREDEFEEVLKYSDHIVFNSVGQLKKFGPMTKKAGKSVGLRINPECSTQVGHEIYDPCSPGSRLGVTIDRFEAMGEETIALLDGIHFHTLCQQNSDDLEKTLKAVEDKFGKYLHALKWVNFGGGHHITRPDYDIPRLEKLIKHVQETYGVEVYLEPGEATVLNAGYVISRVLDTYDNRDTHIAILDSSAACHMPDVIECPYLPPIYQADLEGYDYRIRLGGPTCLSGDNFGYYNFEGPLKENQLIIFGDMALYTTVKNNTFNGMPLPDIYILHKDNTFEKLTNFGYKDFKYRLGK